MIFGHDLTALIYDPQFTFLQVLIFLAGSDPGIDCYGHSFASLRRRILQEGFS